MFATVLSAVLLYVTFACSAIIDSEDKCSGYQLECPEDDTCISLNSKCLSANREPGEECTTWTSEVRWLRCPEGKCDSSVGDWCHDITTCDTMHPQMVNISDTTFESCYSPDPIPNIIMTPSLPSGKHYDYLFFEYKCLPGYLMVGDKYQFCSNGKWCGKTPKCVGISSSTTHQSPPSWLTSSILKGPTISFRSFSPRLTPVMPAIRTYTPVRPPTLYTPPAPRPFPIPSFRPQPLPVIQPIPPRIASGGPRSFSAGHPPLFLLGIPVPTGGGKPLQFRRRGFLSAGDAPPLVPEKPLLKDLRDPNIQPKVEVSLEQTPKDATNTDPKNSKVDPTEVKNTRNSGTAGNSETIFKVIAKVEEVNTKQKSSGMESPNQKSANSEALSSKFSNQEGESTNQKQSTSRSESTDQKQPEGMSSVFDKIEATNAKEKPATLGVDSADKMSDSSKTLKDELAEQKRIENFQEIHKSENSGGVSSNQKFSNQEEGSTNQKPSTSRLESTDQKQPEGISSVFDKIEATNAKEKPATSEVESEDKLSDSSKTLKGELAEQKWIENFQEIHKSANSGGVSYNQKFSNQEEESTNQKPSTPRLESTDQKQPDISSVFDKIEAINAKEKPATSGVDSADKMSDSSKTLRRELAKQKWIETYLKSIGEMVRSEAKHKHTFAKFGKSEKLEKSDKSSDSELDKKHSESEGSQELTSSGSSGGGSSISVFSDRGVVQPLSAGISSGTTHQSSPSWLTSSILIGPTTSFRSPSFTPVRTYTPVRPPTVYMPPAPRPLPTPSFRPQPPPVIQNLPPRFASGGPRPFSAGHPPLFVPGRPVPTGAGKPRQFRPRGPLPAGPAPRPVPGKPLHKNLRGPKIRPKVKVSQEQQAPKDTTNTDLKNSKVGPTTEDKNMRNSGTAGNSETVPKVIAKVEEVNTKQKSSGMESPNQKSANSGAVAPNQKFSNQEEESTNQKPSTSRSESTNQKQPEGITKVVDKIEATNAKEKPVTSGVDSADKMSDISKTLKGELAKQKWTETLLKSIGKMVTSDAKQKEISAKSGKSKKSEKSDKSSDTESDTDLEKKRSESEGSNKLTSSGSSGGSSSIFVFSDIDVGQPLSAGEYSDAAHMHPDSNSLRLLKVSTPGFEVQPMPPRSIRQRRRAGSRVNISRTRPRTPTVSQTRAGTRTINGPPKRARPVLRSNSPKLPTGTGRSPQRKPIANNDRILPSDINLSNSDSSTPSRNFNMKDKILPRKTNEDVDIPPPPSRTLSKNDGLPPPRKTFANSDSLQPPGNTDDDGDILPPPRRTLSKDDGLPPSRKTFPNSDSLQPPSNTDDDGDIPPPPRRTLSKDDGLPPSRKTFPNSDSLQPPSNTDDDGDIPPPPRRALSKDDGLPPSRKTFPNSDSLQPPSNTDDDGDIPPPPRRALSKDDGLPPSRKTFPNSDSLQPPSNTDDDGDIPPPPRRALSKHDGLPPPRKTFPNSDSLQPPSNTDDDGDILPPPRRTLSKDDGLPPSRKTFPNSDSLQPPSNTDDDGDIPPPPRRTLSKDDGLPPSRKTFPNSDSLQPPSNTDDDGDIPPPPRRALSKDEGLPPSRKTFANSDSLRPPGNTDEDGDILPPPRRTSSKDDSMPSKTSANSHSLQPSHKTDKDISILPSSHKSFLNGHSDPPPDTNLPKQSPSTIGANKEAPLDSNKQISSIEFNKPSTQGISKIPQPNEPQQRDIQQSQKSTVKENPSSEITFNTQKVPPSKEGTITLQKISGTDSSKAQKQEHSELDSKQEAKQSVLGSAFSILQKLPELIPKIIGTLKESDNKQKTALSDSADQQLLTSVIDSVNQELITSSVDSARSNSPTSAVENTNRNPSIPENDSNRKQLTTGTESIHQNPSVLKIEGKENPTTSDSVHQKQPTSDAKPANQKQDTKSNQKAASPDTESTNETPIIKEKSGQETSTLNKQVSNKNSETETNSNIDQEKQSSDKSKKTPQKSASVNSNINSFSSSSSDPGQPLSGGIGGGGGGSIIDGADAAPPEYICRANEWTCNDGSCINVTKRCDGYIDCPDSSDEWECSINALCTLPSYPDHGIYTRRVDSNTTVPATPSEEFDTVLLHISCDDGYDATIKDIICINGTWMNEMPECENLDAIKRLPNNSANWCTSTQWRCNDGGCIDNKEKCDGKNDCYDRSDELYCTVKDRNSYSNCVVPDHPPNGMYTFNPPYNPGREVIFVNVSVECEDGFRANKESVSCADGEWNGKNPECIQLLSTANCSEGQWQCINGECISLTSKCDGHYDCIDHTDEAEEVCSKYDANLNPNLCRVPFIDNGKYTINDHPEIQPGEALAQMFLKVTCEADHMLQGMLMTLCMKGRWLTPIPKCTRYCFLKQHPSMQYQCKVMENGVTGVRPCREKEPIGTVVKLNCSMHYYSEEFLPDIKCTEFGWSHSQTCKAECGTLTPHVKKLSIGGRVANRSDIPWHAGIYIKTRDKINDITNYEQICGGTLISYSIVLSAAHCFHGNDDRRMSRRQFAVGIGKIYRLWDDPLEIADDVQKSDVKRIIIPESYHSHATYYQSDIALVEVTKPFEHRAHIVPVCLDLDADFDERHINGGVYGKVAGWGYMNEYGDSSPVLKILDEPIFNHSYCFSKVPAQSRPLITSDKICAGYSDGTQALCGGDSGGGLSIPEVRRGIERYYLRGIVSTTTSSASSGKLCNKYSLTYFTRVVHHTSLISQWWSPI